MTVQATMSGPSLSVDMRGEFFGSPAVGFSMSKYQRWYDQLMDRAKAREIPACYTEKHHVVPRSLGGSDHSSNLVRLTYREHFLAHWLLTKFHRGANLRKMQRALLAMSLTHVGERIISSWQFDTAKRAVRDLELDPEAERLWYERWREKRALIKRMKAKPKKRRRPRPGQRLRQHIRTEYHLSLSKSG